MGIALNVVGSHPPVCAAYYNFPVFLDMTSSVCYTALSRTVPCVEILQIEAAKLCVFSHFVVYFIIAQ